MIKPEILIDAQIIYSALEKALKGGYDWQGRWEESAYDTKMFYAEQLAKDQSWRMYFFTKDFALALWGEDDGIFTILPHKPNWQYHLQEMVIADDQLKYLKESICLN
jgi:hypothetical protein